MVSREEALTAIAAYERSSGFRLAELPDATRESWDKNMRSLFADLGVDLDDPGQSCGAFAGAYVILAMFAPVMVAPIGHLQNGAALVRGLSEFSDAAAMLTDVDSWLRDT